MDDVESNDSIEDESTSDDQSLLTADGLPRTRWLSERFNFNTETSDMDDEFDVDKWPSFAPIATSIGINRHRFSFSSPRTKVSPFSQSDDHILDDSNENDTGEVKPNEDVDSPIDTGLEYITLDSPNSTGQGQDPVLQDTTMGEASIDIRLTDEQTLADSTDILAYKEQAENGQMANSNGEILKNNALESSIHSKSALKSHKFKGNQKDGKNLDGPLSSFRRLISNPMKKPTTSSEVNTEEDDNLTRFGPMTLQEKRRRQAKRAEQLKFWRVREEREAREARLNSRREALEGRSSNAKRAAPAESPSPLRKAVKFNLKRNRIIQFNDE
ncbi:hypothetical protein INT43_009154 [Umbelopsis isabellina]|uniref:Uncharacterized protein n=1 Tax=Mortierella isabellina TaxID=91625 RepID=A0A8H7PCQ0_MORIS|nr:hypothetical protein INT43_009154 [Umbelopsis isabellina]